MDKVLIVGENPYNGTGNGNMLASMIGKLDTTKYDPTLFLVDKTDINLIESLKQLNEFPIITANEQGNIWGHSRLLQLISKHNFDSILFIGIDVWRYSEIIDHLTDLIKLKNMKWYSLIPYDLPYVRHDWLQWINQIQFPFVYSEFGYNLLKPYVPHLQFFRPEPYLYPIFDNYNDKKGTRSALFGNSLDAETILFGFIGANQVRKNIGNIVKGFALHLKEYPNSVLYMHTENNIVWDIDLLRKDYGIPKNQLRIKPKKHHLQQFDVPFLYNACDCMVNPTIQEGLSWTVIEALLCGTTVILSDSTAHKDYIQTEKDYLISLQPTATHYLHLMTEDGPRLIESEKAVEPEAIAEGMKLYIELLHNKNMVENNKQAASRWMSKCSHINKILECVDVKKEEKGIFI
ncbi:MAG: glycosyltransferase [archaeon]